MTDQTLTPTFVHLRVHSEYSVVDGTVRLPDLISRTLELGQPAVALTDLSNLFGLIKFYNLARRSGIKPIAGCDVWITNEEDRDKPFRSLLLVSSPSGYRLLCELLSRAWLTNTWRAKAEIKRDWLDGAQGLIVLSGARHSDVG
ncbi:MAG: PHP domain-containing protein, partial [Burkholderiaceae bacterium]|nr:PHP domain-containing protein [Burkholderiaceae bacterium]